MKRIAAIMLIAFAFVLAVSCSDPANSVPPAPSVRDGIPSWIANKKWTASSASMPVSEFSFDGEKCTNADVPPDAIYKTSGDTLTISISESNAGGSISITYTFTKMDDSRCRMDAIMIVTPAGGEEQRQTLSGEYASSSSV